MRRKINFADLSAHVQEVFSNLCKDGVTPEENYEGFKKLTYDLNHNPNEMFDDEGIEPGPSSDTIGVIYRVGQIMMESQDYRLAKDCFSIVYDITQEEQLEKLLEELENV